MSFDEEADELVGPQDLVYTGATPTESVKIPLEFVPRDNAYKPFDAEDAARIEDDVRWQMDLFPLERVFEALEDIHDDGDGPYTFEESATSTALAFGGELEVDGWIIRVKEA